MDSVEVFLRAVPTWVSSLYLYHHTVELTDEAYWVSTECTFQCRACGFKVPLDYIATDGAVSCVRCGLEQAFDVACWRQALGHAHAIGDFFAQGETKHQGSLTTDGANALTITAIAGRVPLCGECQAAVDVTVTPNGNATVSCTSCDERATYAMPAPAHDLCPGLRAIIATAYRADRPAVHVDESTDAIAIKCPSCSAPLVATEASKFLTCAYCNTVSRIPDRTFWRLRGGTPTCEVLWLLFSGRSPVFQEAARKREAIAEGLRWEAEQERKRQEEREALARMTPEEREQEKREAIAAGLRWEAEQERRRTEERARLHPELTVEPAEPVAVEQPAFTSPRRTVLIAVAVVAVVAIAAAFVALRS